MGGGGRRHRRPSVRRAQINDGASAAAAQSATGPAVLCVPRGVVSDEPQTAEPPVRNDAAACSLQKRREECVRAPPDDLPICLRLRCLRKDLEHGPCPVTATAGGEGFRCGPLSLFQLSHRVNVSSTWTVTFFGHCSACEPRGQQTLLLSAPTDGRREAEAHGLVLASPEPWAFSESAPCPGRVTRVDPTAVRYARSHSLLASTLGSPGLFSRTWSRVTGEKEKLVLFLISRRPCRQSSQGARSEGGRFQPALGEAFAYVQF